MNETHTIPAAAPREPIKPTSRRGVFPPGHDIYAYDPYLMFTGTHDERKAKVRAKIEREVAAATLPKVPKGVGITDGQRAVLIRLAGATHILSRVERDAIQSAITIIGGLTPPSESEIANEGGYAPDGFPWEPTR